MEYTEIVKTTSAQNSPKEPSLKLEEPVIQSPAVSPSPKSQLADGSPVRVPSPYSPKLSLTQSLKEPSLKIEARLSANPELPIAIGSPLRIPSQSSKNASIPSPKQNPASKGSKSPRSPSIKSDRGKEIDILAELVPRGQDISDHVEEITDTIKNISKNLEDAQLPRMENIEKIAKMSKQLTNEANSLRNSIKSLTKDIAQTKQELMRKEVDINFPYHLFLIEIVVNKIYMKCECFDIDYNNLVISTTFLGKQPIILYEPSYGKIESFDKLNVGKSTLFAMTYDKICNICDFNIALNLTKQPPCSNCVTKIAETHMDYSKEFFALREELCAKWTKEQPNDDIKCTTAMPLSKNMYYLSCSDDEGHHDPIGVIEVTVRMSFLGKEITTAFCASSKPQNASFLLKEDKGMTMYSCHKVEMDDQGKILLEEDAVTRKRPEFSCPHTKAKRPDSPTSLMTSLVSSKRSFDVPAKYQNNRDGVPKYDEIFTKMNSNELKIRVPKSTKVERMGKYDKIEELCTCEGNSGDQIQFELPSDAVKGRTHTSNLKYSYTGCDSRKNDNKDRRIVSVTPSNCPVPVDMEKIVHPLKDVFILKIGKKLETKDKKTDLEIELVTPKAPSEKPIDNNNIAQQCSTTEVKKSESKGGKEKKGKKNKKGGKGKGKKGKKKK